MGTGPAEHPEWRSEIRSVPFAKRQYQPSAPHLKHMLDEVGALSETLRNLLDRMALGSSYVLMIQTPHFRVISGSSWWAARVDAAAVSNPLKDALRSVRCQGMLAEQHVWALCPICGRAFPVHRHQKTCDRCITELSPRRRDRRIGRAKGVDPIDLRRRDPDPDPSFRALMGDLPEPTRLQQQTADGGMNSIIFGGGVDGSVAAGSVEANAVLRALAFSGSTQRRIADYFARTRRAR
jgi:hypothetical protein